ncbi:MAG: DNA polymerase IV [Nocardioidaceae bacterium]|jgi:DNA polymerase-4|nr:DNA polymerase IV [Nocardioidaceae bacterium]
MRASPTVLHVDLDAFYAAVEQRDKPSLRGKPVVVGGTGGRGVVATASYEARRFGVRSAMSTLEARARCPHAAFLSPRFDSYRASSQVVMRRLHEITPVVEPLSLDEAFVDLEPLDLGADPIAAVTELAAALRADITGLTDGLTASVGVATSKLVAKIASELAKPDGLLVVPAGTEQELLRPMQVTVIPGVGPATTERLRRIGVHTVAELETVSAGELVRLLGPAHGGSLHQLARGLDDRPVVAEREAKSVSVEDTFASDLTDPVLLRTIVERMAHRVAERLSDARLSGRTVTLKVRHHDFSTLTRSCTLAGPTDDRRVIARLATSLLAEIDASDGVRLLGVGVHGLADWIQDDLFTDGEESSGVDIVEPLDIREDPPPPLPPPSWPPGADVEHDVHGPGWVWGSGRAGVTVRFETRQSPAGPIHTFAVDDPHLRHRVVELPITSEHE